MTLPLAPGLGYFNHHHVLPEWWRGANKWLDDQCELHFYSCYFTYLAVAYGVLAIVALLQLTRIQIRVPEYGWTTQKVFHLVNWVFCMIRAATFGMYTLRDELEGIKGYEAIQLVVFDLPGLLFFTAYTLLVLFWAEIYHQASLDDTRMLRPWFFRINLVIYVVAIILWVLTLFESIKDGARLASAGFLALVSLIAVVAYLIYGCRLFALLRQFPIESRGRKKKLQEVGFITVIGSFCFAIRAVLTSLYIVMGEDVMFDIDMLKDPLLNIVFYVICEIFVAAAVLSILHRLPPRRALRVGNPAQRMYDSLPDRPKV